MKFITEPSSVSFHSPNRAWNEWSWIFLEENQSAPKKKAPKKIPQMRECSSLSFFDHRDIRFARKLPGICVFPGIQSSGGVKNSMKGIPRGIKKIPGWFLFGRSWWLWGMFTTRSRFCESWDISEENIPGEQGREEEQDDRQAGFWGGKRWNSINPAPLLTADSSSWPSQKEKERRWKEETSEKEMKRALLARFFSCLTQLSDFAFKFKTADQTTRATLYSCQEPRWDLSGTLLHARNKKLCLSPRFFVYRWCNVQKPARFRSACMKAGIYGTLSAGLGQGQQEEKENLIISFPK